MADQQSSYEFDFDCDYDAIESLASKLMEYAGPNFNVHSYLVGASNHLKNSGEWKELDKMVQNLRDLSDELEKTVGKLYKLGEKMKAAAERMKQADVAIKAKTAGLS